MFGIKKNPLDPDFAAKMYENDRIRDFFAHVHDQNWEGVGDEYLSALYLSLGFKIYLSEFYAPFIHNGSLKIDEINAYLEMIADL